MAEIRQLRTVESESGVPRHLRPGLTAVCRCSVEGAETGRHLRGSAGAPVEADALRRCHGPGRTEADSGHTVPQNRVLVCAHDCDIENIEGRAGLAVAPIVEPALKWPDEDERWEEVRLSARPSDAHTFAFGQYVPAPKHWPQRLRVRRLLSHHDGGARPQRKGRTPQGQINGDDRRGPRSSPAEARCVLRKRPEIASDQAGRAPHRDPRSVGPTGRRFVPAKLATERQALDVKSHKASPGSRRDGRPPWGYGSWAACPSWGS